MLAHLKKLGHGVSKRCPRRIEPGDRKADNGAVRFFCDPLAVSN